jgi:peptidoglycan hydrolase-like protein with peptidoglycan-binding domain
MNSGPTLSIGATGHDVRRLQRIFVMTKVLTPSSITGSFDATTEQAVKDFQQGAGLTVDGIVGPQTWQAFQPIQTRRHYPEAHLVIL